MALTDFAHKLENVMYRAGSVLVCESAAREPHRIISTDTVADSVTIAGDRTDLFKAGATFTVGADAFTVASSSYSALDNETTIVVEEDVGASLDGQSALLDESSRVFYHLGHVRGVSVSWTPITTEADTSGRRVNLSLDFTASFTLKQTSDTEIAAIKDLVDRLNDVYIAAKPKSAAMTADELTPDEIANGFIFKSVMLLVEGSFDFNNAESALTVTLSRRFLPNEIVTL